MTIGPTADLWLPASAQRETESYKKAPPPTGVGQQFGAWAGRDMSYFTMPGGAVLQFDLSRLTLQDFRIMRDHYQINASLTVLQFMMHEIDWHIEGDNQSEAQKLEDNIRENWTMLVRSLSQAFWAGYSPSVLEYENAVDGIWLSQVKDLVPEECRVNWSYNYGWAPEGHTPPKLAYYDGIRQWTNTFPIPADNTLWYSLLMENGDYYGRKMLRPAFPSWFFSMLMHLFSNRYFERFGEPVPIGRADFDEQVNIGGDTYVNGREAMNQILQSLRNRSVVTLPNGRDDKGNFDWSIDYLESQMRGADFERYMFRLDEEMSIGLLMPTLLIRTADVGSYNLGVGHLQMYLWMLNAIAGDMKLHIDNYLMKPLSSWNFNQNRSYRWVPRKMGKDNAEVLRAVMMESIRTGVLKVDADELGVAIGLKVEEVQALTAPLPAPAPEPDPTLA